MNPSMSWSLARFCAKEGLAAKISDATSTTTNRMGRIDRLARVEREVFRQPSQNNRDSCAYPAILEKQG
jgi:hypothetical protein